MARRMILFSPGFALGCTRTGNYGPNIPAGIRKKILQGQLLHRNACKGNLLLNQPERLVALMPTPMRFQLLANRNLGQTDILCDRPHDGQATGLCRKGVNRKLYEVSKETVYACIIISKTPPCKASSLHTTRDGVVLCCVVLECHSWDWS
jgi:hypothetical protein